MSIAGFARHDTVFFRLAALAPVFLGFGGWTLVQAIRG